MNHEDLVKKVLALNESVKVLRTGFYKVAEILRQTIDDPHKREDLCRVMDQVFSVQLGQDNSTENK